MRKNCDECGAYNGTHWSGCMSRGYLTVGPHPDAPPATERAPVDPTPCPCGIAKADCDYHRPAPAVPFEYGAYDIAPGVEFSPVVINIKVTI